MKIKLMSNNIWKGNIFKKGLRHAVFACYYVYVSHPPSPKYLNVELLYLPNSDTLHLVFIKKNGLCILLELEE